MSWVLRAAPLILNERGNIPTSTEKPTNSKATSQTETPHSTQKSEPPREKGEPLTCSPYKQSGGSVGFSPARTSVQPSERIYLCSYRGGPLGGSWSGLPWLSYTSRGREPKIRFLTSSPQRASWCFESRLTHRHGFPPPLLHHSHTVANFKEGVCSQNCGSEC